MLQTSSKNTTFFVWVTLIISFIAYGRFVTLVIRDITNYLGIACFTVGKKEKKGNGYGANSVQPDGIKQQ
jgi:ethanolaminephosphotransferase